ncbi:hypothetical protein P691DRAFT_677102 [Macrolepiota fuliginosa MF-IS2]|uniref:DUF1793-domain-containing protein n=1 Tax=Macrolepiota fuliginosa MF-IS2 TaxID=1400762 RepID=A0A9P6BY34_9AGAR|nr:hypothetical protein P691DRAFT_677102 [Macrolepiota fuliginosa MF-IS2]
MFSGPTLQIAFFYALLVSARSSFPLGYIPLAVKTPYLNGWTAGNTEATPAQDWPNFFTGDRARWSGIIRVDNQAFQWMGNSGYNTTKTLTSEISPTTSVFRLQAGPIQFNLTFFTPIEPTDYVRQSIPFSYMFVDAFSAIDDQAHSIQIYTDISAEWVTRHDGQVVIWNTTETDTMVYHNVTRQSPLPMTDDHNIAEDSIAYYAMAKRSGFTWRSGAYTDCRGGFVANGTLPNSRDVGFRPVETHQPVFAFSVDLGTVSPGDQLDPVVVALGLVRDPLVTYTDAQSRSGYYMSAYSSIDQVISAFLNDFPGARNRGSDFDSKVSSAASAVSPEYADIISLVTRQIFAAMDITIPSAGPGKFNNSDVKIFMKDMGVSSRTNPVEVIYGAFPALLYFNPLLARDLLVPLLDFQSSSLYENSYAAPDLGTTYPVISGNGSDTKTLGVENCGNMLIMVYAHAVKSGDGSLLSRYNTTFQSWADFLVENSLYPRNFTTADGLSNPDMSNLALKGILGVYSMAKINEAVKASNNTYMDEATQLISSWKQLAVSDDHIDAIYGQSTSWGLIYNIFPAIWLGTRLIENSYVSSFIRLITVFVHPFTPGSDFGFCLDSSQQDVAYPHWILMTAATIPDSSPSVRSQLVQSVYQQVYRVTNKFPLPIKYSTSTGNQLGGIGSAIQGAAFGLLSLSLENIDIKTDPINSGPLTGSRRARANAGAIIGGVIGCLGFLLVLFGGGFFLWRRCQRRRDTFGAIGKSSRGLFPFTVTTLPHLIPVLSHHQNPSQKSNAHITRPPSNDIAAPAVMIPNKRLEALGLQADQGSAHPDNLVLATVLAASRFSQPWHPSPSPTPETDHLRVEVQRLWREIDSIRHIAEPPRYS